MTLCLLRQGYTLLVSCKLTFGVIGTSVEASIFPVSPHECPSTLWTYTRCYYWVSFVLCFLHIVNMSLVINNLPYVLWRKARHNIIHISISDVRCLICLNCGKKWVVVYDMILWRNLTNIGVPGKYDYGIAIENQWNYLSYCQSWRMILW